MLTYPERSAARWWRDIQQIELEGLNIASPPDMVLPVFLVHVRHECEALGGRSVSFHFKEVYTLSPRVGVCYCSVIQPVADDMLGRFPHEDCAGGALVEAGRFAFIYREGRCPDCKVTARSSAVPGVGCRLVEAAVRPPTGRATHGH